MFDKRGPSFLELTRQALVSTRRGYDLIADKFDYTPFRTPDFVLGPLAKVLAEQPLATSLDVCCGTGAATRMLKCVTRERVVGLDFSQGMLAEARRRDSEPFPDTRGLATSPVSPSVAYVWGNALELAYDREFDAVTSVGAFGHIETQDEPAFLEGIYRALRPGGRFVFATATRPSMRSPGYWVARGFNGVMRVRNALISPPFIMYYLTFLWPDVRVSLERAGFRVEARRGLYAGTTFERGLVVVAQRPV
jgi:ubiquinone/menaquinone biosynthesis C-methylase UbiE